MLHFDQFQKIDICLAFRRGWGFYGGELLLVCRAVAAMGVTYHHLFVYLGSVHRYLNIIINNMTKKRLKQSWRLLVECDFLLGWVYIC
jgi:hypothetical protein